MLKEQTGFGSTIEEAYEQAKTNLILELGAEKFSEDDIQFDIIEMPKKKTLGIFGGCKAEVKAFIELPDPKKPKANKPKKDKKPSKAKAEKPQKATAEVEAKTAIPEDIVTVSADEIAPDSRAGKAVAYLKNILSQLGCENIEIKVAEKENGAALYLSGDGLGVVIGRRGETLDALQYLTSLSANSASGYYKVTINIGNYRERREQALTSLARRISNQVLRTGRNRTLEPMNPYERRIIHTAVQEIEGVTSNSIGEGSGRRVVISAVGGRKGGAQKAAPVEAREPKKDSEIPLYGKIN
ncbi:MAG: RNA-binding cell elongation regulator Jag/EloR [Acutalibacteraceae bacterium]|nr:RNA-binding cell elongation regulator Jag/EloR [Acutalibacteraceae bacterium]